MQGDHDERDLQLDAPDQDVRLGGTLRQARRGPQVHGVYVRMNWIFGSLSRYPAFTQFVSGRISNSMPGRISSIRMDVGQIFGLKSDLVFILISGPSLVICTNVLIVFSFTKVHCRKLSATRKMQTVPAVIDCLNEVKLSNKESMVCSGTWR